MTQTLSPLTADIEALNDVATVLWEARALYETVFNFITKDELLDPLADLAAARGRWCVHLRGRIEDLGQMPAQSLLTNVFDELNIDICRCLVGSDHRGAIRHIETCEERVRQTMKRHLGNSRLTPVATTPLTETLLALESMPGPLAELRQVSGHAV